jgi:hypothetical protein
VMGGMLTMATPQGVAIVHSSGASPEHTAHGDAQCPICPGCCPGSSTPPPNRVGTWLDAAPTVIEKPGPRAPTLPRLAIEHHWQPQPIGPPAPAVS